MWDFTELADQLQNACWATCLREFIPLFNEVFSALPKYQA